MPKLGRFLTGQIAANTELQNKQDLPTVFGPCFSCNPHYFIYIYIFFFPKQIAKLPKWDMLSHTLLVTINRLLFCLWTDPLWSWCYSLEKFNCRGWCVVLSAVHKVFGYPKFPQPSEWTNFPHATLCVSINEILIIRSTTAPWNVPAGISIPAALLSSAPQCLRPVWDPVSWHQWESQWVAML